MPAALRTMMPSSDHRDVLVNDPLRPGMQTDCNRRCTRPARQAGHRRGDRPFGGAYGWPWQY